MTIRTKILSGYLLIGIILILTGTTILSRLEKGPEELAVVRKISLQHVQAADFAMRHAVKESFSCLLRDNCAEKSAFYAAVDRFDREMAAFTVVTGKDAAERVRESHDVATILQTREALVSTAKELFRQYGESGRVAAALFDKYHRLTEKIEAEVAEIVRHEEADLDDAYLRVAKTLTFSRRAHHVIGALTLALSIVLGFFVAGIISRPISRLTDAAGKMANSDLDVAIDTGARDEIGGLARAFDVMRKNLKEKITELNAEVAARRRSELELEAYAAALERERFAADQARLVAEAANRSKSEFLANMSHELRTPLNAIIGFADVLNDGLGGCLTERQKRYADNICTSGRHLHRMIEDLLDLAKMEAGSVAMQVTPFPLRDVLADVFATFRDKAASRSISLSLEMEPEVEGEFWNDQIKLKQILHNLLSNAVKFTPEQGSVRISARRARGARCAALSINTLNAEPHRDCIEISVEDTGIGISAENMPRIFDGLTQLESPYSKSYGGAGVGLSLTKKLVELLGGVIRVESEVGRGSCFTVVMPTKINAAQAVS